MGRAATWLVVVAGITASRSAAASYGGGSWACERTPGDRGDPLTVCIGERAVPEGCPIHVVVEHGKLATGALAIDAARAKVHARATLVDSFREHYRYMDMMNCDWVEADKDFDRLTIELGDARAGDAFSAWGFRDLEITKPGRCLDAVWPHVAFSVGACDKPPPRVTAPPATANASSRAVMNKLALVSTILTVAGSSAIAAPVVAFDRLFHEHATWRLPCTSSFQGEANVLPANAAVECAIDTVSYADGAKRAHLDCAGPREIMLDLRDAYEARTFVATRAGLWSVDDDRDAPAIDVAKLVHEPPLLPAHPIVGTREVKHDRDGDGGIRYATSAYANSWCVTTRPWGTGGGGRAWLMCFSPAGEITGVAAFKSELTTWKVRCGSAPDLGM